MSSDEKKLLDVVARAYLAAVMPDFRYRQTTVTLDVCGFAFRAAQHFRTGSRTPKRAAPSDAVIAEEYVRKVRRYAQGLIEEKRARPQSDIFSTIVHARFGADGSTLPDHELRSFFGLLFPAGAETTPVLSAAAYWP